MEINKEKYSNTLIQMKRDNTGYNSNNSQGKDIKSLMKYEVLELKNNDIFYTMKNFYKDYKVPLWLPSRIKIWMTLRYLSRRMNCNINEIKGIWLTLKEYVIKYYVSNPDNEAYENNEDIMYSFSLTNMIPISDLDTEGSLFVYKGGN